MSSSRNRARPLIKTAFQLFDADQVADAREVEMEAGAGNEAEFASDLMLIHAEAFTSELSFITREREWMEIEQIRGEQQMLPAQAADIAEAAIRKVWSAIGLKAGVNTLITFLERDIALPIHLAATGYVTAKKPYAKYCVLGSTGDDPDALDAAVQRLAACHAAAVISNSMAPPW